ncbi:hypothetical protein AB0I28_21915 [Phytomonospora sp. NPDC050363]|uniref:hypothetical protein n=1 Tax=Phytomonospora sp. NPDC050363 TaxID=3155642 RepID=UPI0033D093DB
MHPDEPRPDIAAAAEDLAVPGPAGTLALLDRHVRDDEIVVCLAAGETASGRGLLALTNERLVFAAGSSVETLPLSRVDDVTWNGLLVGVVTIRQGEARMTVKAVGKADGRRFAEAAKAALG